MDIEEIRKKKLEELKEKSKAKEELSKYLAIAREVCDEKAYDRLTNVMHANQELFMKALEYCVLRFKRTGSKVDDKSLKEFLSYVSSTSRKEPKIRFKRK